MQFNNNKIFGTDISLHQGFPPKFPVTDFVKMRNYGMRFTILKASQANYPDPSFVYNRAAVDGVLPWHSYHYYDNFVDARLQADRFWATNEDNPPQMLWLDLEDKHTGAFRGLNYWYNFLERLKYISKYPADRIGIYTGISFWKEETASWSAVSKNYFKQYSLWLANYWLGKEQMPPFQVIEVPYPWTDENVLILQSGTPAIGKACGVSSLEIDFNIFNGGEEKFRKYFVFEGELPPAEIPVEPEPEGPALITGVAKKTSLPNIRIRRSLPNGDVNSSGGTIGGILPGQTFEADRKMQDSMGTLWIHVVKVNGKALPEAGWSAGFLLDWKEGALLPPIETPKPEDDSVLVTVVWDDQNPDLNFKCRTQDPGFIGPKSPPAINRFYPKPISNMGDFRTNMERPYDWKPAIVRVNGGVERKFYYLTGRKRAMYNDGKRGWPMQMYGVMCGQQLKGKFVEITNKRGKKERWFEFETLKPSDLSRAATMTRESHPWLVHDFTCVGWDPKKKVTRRIPNTNTLRGRVFYFLMSQEGKGYIPARHVVP